MNHESYDTAQVCLNGHSINSSYHDYPQFSKDFCPNCGESTITSCPNCSTEVQGSYREFTTTRFVPPRYCYNCGKSFPWTERALQASRELAGGFDELQTSEIEQLKESLGALVKSGPQSVVAESRYKSTMSKVSGYSNEAMQSILKDVVDERMRKSLFGE